MSEEILSIRGLNVRFHTATQDVYALNEVDLDVKAGERLAIIGESGCGKSVLAHAVCHLLDDIADVFGEITFKNKNLSTMGAKELEELRGSKICMIPQNPQGAFNPVVNVGEHFREVLTMKKGLSRTEADNVAKQYLAKAGFEDPNAIMKTYAHRMSGGMCERALIGLTACMEPELIIADEPTKGLDALSKRRILDTFDGFSKDSALIIITHDLATAKFCEKLCVMYAGEIVEMGPTVDVLSNPLHPYTKGLISSDPRNGMIPIPGRHFVSVNAENTCRFRSRCSQCTEKCITRPELMKDNNRYVRCFYA